MLCTMSTRSCGRSCEESGEDAVAQQVRHLVPVADGVEALERQVVGVVGGLAGGAGPADERRAEALAHLLLLLVEDLLGHLLPGEAQVAHGGDEPQADGPPRREEQRALVAVPVHPLEELGDRLVREVAGGEDVGEVGAGLAGDAAGLGEVGLDEGAVAAGEPAERVQGLDHAGALRPAAPGAGGQRHHGDLAPSQRGEPSLAEPAVPGERVRGHHVLRPDVLDHRARRQAVLGQADAAVAQVGADLLVLGAVEAVLLQELGEGALALGLAPGPRQEGVEERLDHPAQLRPAPAGGPELVELGAPRRRQRVAVLAEQRGHGERVVAGRHQGRRAPGAGRPRCRAR